MDDLSVEDIIYGNVRERGYVDKWTAFAFIARQIAKMQEELGELADIVLCGPTSHCLWRDINLARDTARSLFDDGGHEFWDEAFIADYENKGTFTGEIRRELDDMFVVLCCIRATVERIDGKKSDWDIRAIAKSRGDILRGVRGQEEEPQEQDQIG